MENVSFILLSSTKISIFHSETFHYISFTAPVLIKLISASFHRDRRFPS